MVLCFGWPRRGRGDSGSGFVGEAATSSIVTMTMDRVNPLTEVTAFGRCNSHKENGRKFVWTELELPKKPVKAHGHNYNQA